MFSPSCPWTEVHGYHQCVAPRHDQSYSIENSEEPALSSPLSNWRRNEDFRQRWPTKLGSWTGSTSVCRLRLLSASGQVCQSRFGDEVIELRPRNVPRKDLFDIIPVVPLSSIFSNPQGLGADS